MGVLSDPKLELFAQELLKNLALDMPRSKAAEDAARAAGYTGKSIGPNARKRAQRKDVKARMIELAAPAVEARKAEIEATVDWAIGRCVDIASPDLGVKAIKVSDQLNALKLAAQILGWEAPAKTELTGKDGAPLQPTRVEIIQLTDARHPAAASGENVVASAPST